MKKENKELMHNENEFDDSHNLRSRKRYKIDHGDHLEHHRSHSSEPRLNRPSNLRKESGFIPPTPHKTFINPHVTSQTSHGGQNQPLV